MNSWRKIRLLLLPSWLSGLISIAGSLLVMGGSFALIKSNGVRANELFALHSATAGVTSGYKAIALNLDHNRIISNLPLFIFWGGVGLIIYYFVIKIFKSLHSFAELSAEMEYVHSNKQALAREALLHVVLRVVDLIVWLLFIVFTVHHSIPYCLSYARTAALKLDMHSALTFVAATLLLIVVISIHTVFLRLLLLRTRVFSNVLES